MPRVVEALLRFLDSHEKDKGRAFIRRVVIRKLYGRRKNTPINADIVDEITNMAAVRALAAKTPPWTEYGIPGWVARVTKNTVVDYFREERSHKEQLRRDVDVAELPGSQHGPATDWGARAHLIAKYLDSIIGDDPRKVETFRLMCEKELHGRSLAELAAQHKTTEAALSMRIHKLRKELIPHRAIMDQEKPRRAILVGLWVGAGAIVVRVIVAIWLWLLPPPHPPVIEVLPAPSASAAPAPMPTFNQAFPTVTPDAGTTDKTPPPPVQPRPRPAPAPGPHVPGDKGP